MGIDSHILITLDDWDTKVESRHLVTLIQEFWRTGILDYEDFVFMPFHTDDALKSALMGKSELETIEHIMLKRCTPKIRMYDGFTLAKQFKAELSEVLQTTQLKTMIIQAGEGNVVEDIDIAPFNRSLEERAFNEEIRRLVRDGLIRVPIVEGELGISGLCFETDYDFKTVDFRIFSEMTESEALRYFALAYKGTFVIQLHLRNHIVSPAMFRRFLSSEPCALFRGCIERAFGQPSYVTSDFSRG